MLIDFGFAIQVSEKYQKCKDMWCGTVSYMAPEIIRRREYDPR